MPRDQVLIAVAHLRLVDGVRIAEDLGPLGGDAGGGEALLRRFAQAARKRGLLLQVGE